MLSKIVYLLSVIYSYIFCFKYLPFSEAKKCPFLIHWRVKTFISKTASIKLKNISKHSIKIGMWGGSYGISRGKVTQFCITDNAQIIFNGQCCISKGCNIVVRGNAILSFGNHFFVIVIVRFLPIKLFTLVMKFLWDGILLYLIVTDIKLFLMVQLKIVVKKSL